MTPFGRPEMSAPALPTRPLWVLLLSLGLLAVTASSARVGDPLPDPLPSQSLPDSVRQAALRDFHGPDMEGKDGPLAKAGLDLLLLYHQHRTRPGGGRALSAADEPGETARGDLQVQNGRVVIDATAAGDVAALAADLDSLGMTDVAAAGGLVSGRFPIAKIPALARLATLRGATPSRMRTRSDRPGRGAASSRAPRSVDDDRPPPRRTAPGADDSVAAPSEASPSPDTEAPHTSAAPPTRTDTAPEAAEAPVAAPSPTVYSSDAADDSSAVLWLLIVLVAAVLLLEER